MEFGYSQNVEPSLRQDDETNFLRESIRAHYPGGRQIKRLTCMQMVRKGKYRIEWSR